MRYLLYLWILLIFACTSPKSHLVSQPLLKAIDSQNISAEVENSCNEITVPDERKTPNVVPPEVFPNQSSYTIRTRIVVEGQPVLIPQINSDPKELMWWARTAQQVVQDLEDTKEVYKDIGLNFHVIEFVYREYVPGVGFHFAEARSRPDTMTIVYMLPNIFPFDGYSSVPWNSGDYGIVVGYSSERYTLAHEIGHYFGLLHVFSNDYVEDTPEQKVFFCKGKKGSTENCGNVMNYCIHNSNQITKGQLDRFVRFLRAKRLSHLVKNSTDILLNGHYIPDSPSLKFSPSDLLLISNECPLTGE